jgi:hypothetical protein
MSRALRPAGMAWVGLAAYVTVIDVLLLRAKKNHGYPYCSMSESFGDALRHPWKRWPVITAWLVITLHLFGHFVPKRFEIIKSLDPLGWIARKIAFEVESIS